MPAPNAQQGTLKLIRPLIGGESIRRIHGAVVLAVLGQISLASIPLLQQIIVDDTIITHQRSLHVWITVLVMTGIVCFGLQYLRRSAGFKAAARSQRDLQTAAFTASLDAFPGLGLGINPLVAGLSFDDPVPRVGLEPTTRGF